MSVDGASQGFDRNYDVSLSTQLTEQRKCKNIDIID